MTQTPHQSASRLLAPSEELWTSSVLPVLSDYVRIRCLSPEFDSGWAENGEIARAARLLAEWADGLALDGTTVEVVEIPGLTPVILADIAASPGRSGPTTVLYGHLDKQPPLGAWRAGLSAFEPVLEGDRLYGRGTADDGYSIFVAMGAIALLQRDGQPHGRCLVIIEASEESGSPHLGPYLEQLSDRLGEAGAGLVVCLDSGASTYDRLWATTSLRGLVTANLTVSVLSEGVHSGAGGGVVPDSFRILRYLLDRIEDAGTGQVLLESCRAEIPPARREEAIATIAQLGAAALDRFPVLPDIALDDRPPVDQLLAKAWEPSLAYVGADGLPAVAEAGNVLRPFTRLKLALRIPPPCDSAAVAAELTRLLTEDVPPAARVEVNDVIPADGFDAPETAGWLAEAMAEASAELFGAPPGQMGEGGTIPFLAELAGRYGSAQFLVTGVLGPGSNAHGPNEMLHIPTAKRVTAAVALVLTRVPLA